MGYRTIDSHISQDVDKRMAQLANLKGFKGDTFERLRRGDLDIITFAGLLGVSFKERPAQEVVLRVLYGLGLTQEQFDIYKKLCQKTYYQTEEKTEAVMCLGARSGKSLIASIIALFEVICRGHIWRQYLGRNEIGWAIIVATKQAQCNEIILRNCGRLLLNSPFKILLTRKPTKATLEFKTGFKIASIPCSSTAGRGLPIITLIFDEVAHFFTEGPKADTDVYNSLSPRLVQFTGAKKVLISTPAAKQGLFWKFFNEGFDVPGRATFHAETVFMNPEVDKAYLDKEKARDIDNYNREYLAEFADRLSQFFSSEKLDICMDISGDQKPQEGRHYVCALDQSGLSGRDKFGVSIAHREGEYKVIVDVARAYETKNANSILAEIKAFTSQYKIRKVLIDRFGAGWVQQALEGIGLEVEFRPGLGEIYSNFKSLMTAGNLSLPDHPELRSGLLNTVAFYGRNNSFTVQHDRSSEGHADMADSTVAAVFAASGENNHRGACMTVSYDVLNIGMDGTTTHIEVKEDVTDPEYLFGKQNPRPAAKKSPSGKSVVMGVDT